MAADFSAFSFVTAMTGSRGRLAYPRLLRLVPFLISGNTLSAKESNSHNQRCATGPVLVFPSGKRYLKATSPSYIPTANNSCTRLFKSLGDNFPNLLFDDIRNHCAPSQQGIQQRTFGIEQEWGVIFTSLLMAMIGRRLARRSGNACQGGFAWGRVTP